MRTILRALLLGLCVFSFQVAVFSQQVAKTIPNSTSPDGLIGFLEFKPTDYGSQKHPLIIFLHGIGERGNGTSDINRVTANAIPLFCARGATMRFTAGGQTSSFVVLSPQLSNWYGYWPTFYVREMIKYAKANLQIDPDRIYITGLSLGGGGTWRAITDATGWDYTFDAGIAAAAPVCGTQEETDADFCKTIGDNHLPVWNFHSMDDGTVNVGASQHAEILANNCGITPAIKFTYYQSGGHSGAWINAYDTGHITRATVVNGNVVNFTANPNLYEWLLSNKRNTGSSTPTYTAPVANAGNAQVITLPLNTITLTGSGSGTNGATISSYSWTKTSGPSAGVISLPLLNTTLVTGLVQGTYVFTLTVTDNHGLTSTSSVTITVNPLIPVNQPPVANAGSNISITLPLNYTPLNGGGSYDPDGTIQGYNWSKTSGPDNYIITGGSTANPSAINLIQGVYVFTLWVTDNNGAMSSSTVSVTVNPAPVSAPAAQPATEQPVGYIKMSTSALNACYDATASGRTPVYGSGIANGNILYLDAAHTKPYNGGWNWFSVTTSPGSSTVAQSFAIFPNGSINLLFSCSVGAPVTTPPVTTPPVVTPPVVTPPATSNLLGYVKMSSSAINACTDGSSDGRTPVYGNSINDGGILYTDAALTQPLAGGWNWFSFESVLGGAVTQSFAVYPNGGVFYSKPCSSYGLRTIQGNTETPEQEEAMLKHLRDSAAAATIALPFRQIKLNLYPNPVHITATIELNSDDNGVKLVSLYSANGVLKAKYTWTATKGKNVFSLQNVAGLANGLYIVEIRNSNGTSNGKLKFIKM